MDRRWERDEFLAWCDRQPAGRYERVDGRIVAMAPERAGHARVKASVWLALRTAIRAAGVACEALPDGMTVAAGDSDYEPDCVVTCGPRMADDAIHAPNPVIVVEVLSPATAAVDTGQKLADYMQVASIAHCLVVHPARRVVTHHRRTAEGWIDTRIVFAGSIALSPPGIELVVEDIYDAA